MNERQLIPVREIIPDVYIHLYYATEDNFFKQALYDFNEPMLRPQTLEKLKRAQSIVRAQGYSLKVWDGFRPYRAQCRMWEIFPDPDYVSDPKTGYLGHSRGNTVDVTLVKANGDEIEMPSAFDDFSKKANRDYSDAAPAAREHALVLENAMKAAGFGAYFDEWWHYPDTDEYPIIYD